MKEVRTWNDLLHAIEAMTPIEKLQQIQIAKPPSDGRPVALARGIALGTVGAFEFEGSRSVVDNRYHANEVVLLIDGNPFAEDGAMCHEMRREGPPERPVMRTIPNYGPGGKPTPREEQFSPEARKDLPAYIGAQCIRRTEDFPEAMK